ncbi:hypothetical protein KKE26_00635 [bacterium]|nr:hypothetical protein [bacterium]MBU1753131.1 hypothetical protein [bacterium]
MIDVKEAAQRASQYLQCLISSAKDITLEEVELTDDEKFWFITLSCYNIASDVQSLFGNTIKVFKVFKVKRDNGEVISMKIRTV